MTFADRMRLPLLALGALALQACSSSNAAPSDDNMSMDDMEMDMNMSDQAYEDFPDGNVSFGNADMNMSYEDDGKAPKETPFAPGQEVSDVGRALCMQSASERYGISADDSTGSTFAGGGESLETVEAQVTLNTAQARGRDIRCEIQGGAVVSIGELDAEGALIPSRE